LNELPPKGKSKEGKPKKNLRSEKSEKKPESKKSISSLNNYLAPPPSGAVKPKEGI
jgi:hypothetical protein